MRWLFAVLTVMTLAAPAHAAPLRPADLQTEAAIRAWMVSYRENPNLKDVSKAIRALSRLGAFHDPERCGIYVGFLAGALRAHPHEAGTLIAESFAINNDDRWVVVRAIAYSGLPDWKQRLRQLSSQVPARQVMIDQYINGKLPTLSQFEVAQALTTYERMKEGLRIEALFGKPEKKLILEPSGDVLDVFWGYYFATGAEPPIKSIVALLAWARDRDDADRLAIGSMAKFTLASNAMHDPTLVAMLKRIRPSAPKKDRPVLDDVVKAAETVDTARLRREAMAAIGDVKTKGPESKRTANWWGYVGQSVIAGGCLAAGLTGHVELGVPCVVGGATASAMMNFWNNAP